MEHKKIAIDQFVNIIRDDSNRLNLMSVNIYAHGKFNMNGKLTAKLGGKRLILKFTDDARHFLLTESSSEDAIAFPKSGSKKLADLEQYIKQHKILTPARYFVWYDSTDNFYQGDLEENPIKPQPSKAHNSQRN